MACTPDADKLKAELDAARAHGHSGTSDPRTPVEEEVLAIWQRVLGQDAIGLQDDFLALGGDSFMAARILFYVQQAFAVNLTLTDIFDAPTIRSMADLIQERQK